MVKNSASINHKLYRLLVWSSLAISAFFILVIAGLVYLLLLYRSGGLDFDIVNFASLKFSAPGSCFTTTPKSIKDLGLGNTYLDSKGRVAFKDNKGQERVICLQNITSQSADKYDQEIYGNPSESNQ